MKRAMFSYIKCCAGVCARVCARVPNAKYCMSSHINTVQVCVRACVRVCVRECLCQTQH